MPELDAMERKELEFYRADAGRTERMLQESDAEVAALRSLIKDMVKDMCPAIATFPYTPDDGWRYQIRRVLANLCIRQEA